MMIILIKRQSLAEILHYYNNKMNFYKKKLKSSRNKMNKFKIDLKKKSKLSNKICLRNKYLKLKD